ncbi:MAG: DUF3362 domain-containing protein [Lentimicrobiaceae bacterium]|nr:DUF3362 domain-containing protein [Lentimicrobiaceae bacterium]
MTPVIALYIKELKKITVKLGMYYTGMDPYTQKSVYVAKAKEDKINQQRFFFWYKPQNRAWLTRSLNKMGRADLMPRLFKKPDK